MSMLRFSRQAKFVVCAALLAVGFAGCSGSGEDDSSELANAPSDVDAPSDVNAPSESTDPNANESVGGIPVCQPGCFTNETNCRQALEREPEPGCFCTQDPGCCALPRFAILCEP